MAKIILLTAEPRTGKSTAIKKIINEIGLDKCGGFYTEEIRNEIDRIGFDCVTLDGRAARIADVSFNTEVRVSKYGVSIENFENIGIKALEEAMKTKDIVVVDEIGPMQLLSDKFKNVLESVFNSDKIVLGTIFFKPHPDVDEVKKNKDIVLYELTFENRDKLPYDIVSIIKNTSEKFE